MFAIDNLNLPEYTTESNPTKPTLQDLIKLAETEPNKWHYESIAIRQFISKERFDAMEKTFKSRYPDVSIYGNRSSIYDHLAIKDGQYTVFKEWDKYFTIQYCIDGFPVHCWVYVFDGYQF